MSLFDEQLSDHYNNEQIVHSWLFTFVNIALSNAKSLAIHSFKAVNNAY